MTFLQRPNVYPVIYGYVDSGYEGYIKIGYTEKSAEQRVREQYPTLRPNDIPYTILFEEPALKSDGTVFGDNVVFRELERQGIYRQKDKDGKITEWFAIEKMQFGDNSWDYFKFVSVIKSIRDGTQRVDNRHQSFGMRPEQRQAVYKTTKMFREWSVKYPDQKPHFLWNAKMRFGKTFATYQFAKEMGYTKVLVLTFKPAVEESWKNDLLHHVDFDGWQFYGRGDIVSLEHMHNKKPFVCFGSFQDYLGRTESGGIKAKNEWVHNTVWDLIVFDEYHYGAWREKATALTNEEELLDRQEKHYLDFEQQGKLDNDIQELELFMPISAKGYLYLSGTPFRALNSGEFSDDQIFSWTYSDEQRAKQDWKGETNPYASLPRMVMMNYQLPEYIVDVAKGGEYNEFDLNTFFRATGGGYPNSKFVYENEVQKWLYIITGELRTQTVDNLKMGGDKPMFPFNNSRLKGILSHTVWFLPNIASCDAMRELIRRDNTANTWFKNNFELVYAYGKNSGVGVEALQYAKSFISGQARNLGHGYLGTKNSLSTRTITLSCGKLTTGVTIPEWTGIFMLRNLQSPETYFQAAFRVQSPWTIKNIDGLSPNSETILKQECYIFDFAPNRALKQVAEYSRRLNRHEQDTQKAVADFISFLPILAYNGNHMIDVSASDLLDLAFHGTTATLLARRWESALLVNVDNATLSRLINDPKAYAAVMRIEGVRKLGDGFIETIIAKSADINQTKKEASEKGELSKNQKKALTEDEKEEKNKRKIVQEKLIKFATRIPVFMYMTDYREQSLRDVITKIDFNLFTKVTGLTTPDFELLVSIGLFNEALMNDAVFKFRRYEDDSLSYTTLAKESTGKVGGWSTVVSGEGFDVIG